MGSIQLYGCRVLLVYARVVYGRKWVLWVLCTRAHVHVYYLCVCVRNVTGSPTTSAGRADRELEKGPS